MNMQKILKQAQDLQKKLEHQQAELEGKVYEATAGGGMVTVQVNGRGEVLSVKLEAEVFQAGDKDMIEDLIVAGLNEAIKRSQEAQQTSMAGLMGNVGLKIPGLF